MLSLAGMRQPRYQLRAHRHHAQRLPKSIKAYKPRGIVQIDTVCVLAGPQSRIKHFNAYIPVAKWTFGKAFRRATVAAAKDFLAKVIADMSFKIEAVQIDGGSKFKAEFEDACKARGIFLYELRPKSPKLNGAWRYEFYAVYNIPPQVDQISPLFDSYQSIYNHHRPHGVIGGMTPASYFRQRTQGDAASQMS